MKSAGVPFFSPQGAECQVILEKKIVMILFFSTLLALIQGLGCVNVWHFCSKIQCVKWILEPLYLDLGFTALNIW